MPHSPEPHDRAARFAAWDAITPEQLRAAGGMKWTLFANTIGAWVAESDLGTAPAITAALHRAVDDGVMGYLPPALSTDMSRATSEWMLDRFDWRVSASRVHPMGDVIVAFELAITRLSRPGSAIIVPTPAYMPFLTVPGLHDRDVIQVPMVERDGRLVLDLEAIDRELTAGAGLVVLCNPFNPIGRVFDRDELLALAAVVDRHDARVFADEVHAPIIFDGRQHVPYASISDSAARHSLTATSASKAWNLPGLKTAQVILTSDDDEKQWERLGPMASHGASTLGVIANTVAYRESREWLDDTVAYYDANRRLLGDLLAERLPEVGYRAPEGSYIAWLDVSKLGLGDDPATVLRERAGLAVTDGRACGVAGAGHVRVILATPRPIVEEIVERLARARG